MKKRLITLALALSCVALAGGVTSGSPVYEERTFSWSSNWEPIEVPSCAGSRCYEP